MENNKFEKGIKEIKKVALSATDKKRIFDKIIASPMQPAPLPSPFVSLHSRKYFYYIAVPCLVILLGGGVAWASQESLPGDTLYGVKTKIVEPVVGALKHSSESKARYQGTLAIKRFTETERLIQENRLDESTEEEIDVLLHKHSENFNKEWQRSATPSQDILSDFGREVEEHEKLLEELNTDDVDEENEEEERKPRKIKVPATVFEKVEQVKQNIEEKTEDTEEHLLLDEKEILEDLEEEVLPELPIPNLSL